MVEATDYTAETVAAAQAETFVELHQAADDIGLEAVMAGVLCFAALRKDPDV